MSNVTFIRTLTDDLNQNLLVLIGRLYIVAELSTSIDSTLSSPCLNLLTLALAFSISLTVSNRRKQADAVVENNNKWTQAPSVCVSGKHLRFNHDCPSYVKVRHCINKPISIRASWGKGQEMERGMLWVVVLVPLPVLRCIGFVSVRPVAWVYTKCS